MLKKKTVNDEPNDEKISERTASEALANNGNQSVTARKSGVWTAAFEYAKKPSHWWAIALVCLLTLGAAGAGLKYLNTALKQSAEKNQTTTAGELPSGSNTDSAAEVAATGSFLPSEPAKEYVYAGSRMLTTEEPGLAPTAAPATLRGRVTDSDGNVVMTWVTLTDSNGNSRTVETRRTGIYVFNNVAVGQTYLVTANHQGNTFTPSLRTVSVTGDMTDLDFVAEP